MEQPAAMPASDARTLLLTMANTPVDIINQAGQREIVTAIEARLLELASGDCRRRLFCQDFIALVRQALRMPAEPFNAAIPLSHVERFAPS
jgi:hypothetical protein